MKIKRSLGCLASSLVLIINSLMITLGLLGKVYIKLSNIEESTVKQTYFQIKWLAKSI